jgi:hypothetical protein
MCTLFPKKEEENQFAESSSASSANSMRPYITSKPNQKLARASHHNSTVEDRKFLEV